MSHLSKKIHNFYRSKKWVNLRNYYYFKKEGKCEKCGKLLGMGEFNVHHTIELDEDNVDNPLIALNEELLELLCVDCHNLEHNRFKKNEERVLFDDKGNVIWR